MRATRLILVVLLLATLVSAQRPTKKPAAQAPQAAATTQPSGPIVIRGGKLLTITHGVIENGVLVMEGGKITAVGRAADVKIPANAKVIEAAGMTIYPGLIDSETNLGLTEVEADRMTNDMIEMSDEIMPHMHTWEAFHAETELIPVTRINGITNAVVVPARQTTLPGQDAFIQLAGRDASEMLLIKDIAIPLNFTGEQRRNESFDRARFPMTRMGMASQLRQTFIEAQEYMKKQQQPQAAGGGDDKPPKRDLRLEALLPYLRGERPVVVAAQEPSDILVAMNLAQEFKLKVILNRITFAHPILDKVAAMHVPVIVGPIYQEPKEHQRYDAVFRLPAELHKHGIKFAFASYDSHNARNLPYAAGYAVAYGLPYDEALRAITINPAEMWGVADKLGSLDVGKTANVVIANGDPLDVKTDVKHVFIEGREIPLESRQTRLRDLYWK